MAAALERIAFFSSPGLGNVVASTVTAGCCQIHSAAGRPRPWLGLTSEEVRGRLFVMRVARGGPAFQAGIRPGDLVIGVNGKPVSGLADFYRKVWATGDAGVSVPINVLQGITAKPVLVKSSSRYDWLKLNRSY